MATLQDITINSVDTSLYLFSQEYVDLVQYPLEQGQWLSDCAPAGQIPVVVQHRLAGSYRLGESYEVTVLYGLMGIGAARVYLGADSRERSRGLRLFWLQLGFNFCWSPVFFNLRWYGFALIWLAVLWGLILRMALEFGKTDRKAAWMQAPYLLWTAFALYLNFGVLLLNGR